MLSIELGAGGLHLLLGERAVLLEEGGELLGRVAERLETEIVEVLLPELGGIDDPRRFGGELGDRLARRAGGRSQPEVERGVEARKAGLGEGGHLRNQRIARFFGSGGGFHYFRFL